jgi:predicted DNA-binding transcriptional regulator AlpA
MLTATSLFGRVDATMRKREHDLLLNLAPRGLSRVQSAAYIGVSPTLFDEMVRDGRMPKPTRINARTVWDRARLDEAFVALADDDDWGDPAV